MNTAYFILFFIFFRHIYIADKMSKKGKEKMNFTKNELTEAVMCLTKEGNNTPATLKLAQALDKMLQEDNEYNLINKSHYFATVLWQRQDIEDSLKEDGFPATKENINKVLHELSISQLESCSDGFEHIHFIISTISHDLDNELDDLEK